MMHIDATSVKNWMASPSHLRPKGNAMSENLENVAAFASCGTADPAPACGSADPKAAPACGTACGSADPAAAPACGSADPAAAPACGSADPKTAPACGTACGAADAQ